MNLTVKIADLTRELGLLEKVVAKKANPVLQNILFTAQDGRLQLSASDIEIELTCQCAGLIEEPGTITIPAKRLLDMMRVQSHVTVRFQTHRESVKVEAGAFTSTLQTLGAADFPLLPDIVGESVIHLPRVALLHALKQVRFVVEDKTNTQQYFMQAVKLEIADQRVVAVATSSNRLALTSFAVSQETTDELLLPLKAVDELLELLDEDDTNEVLLSHTAQHLSFVVGARHLKSGQLEGKFPAYRRVIPTESSTIVVARRQELAAMLRRQVLIDDVVHLTFTENDLQASAVKSGVGESQEIIKVGKTGPDTEIYVSGGHVIDFLAAAQSPTVTLNLRDKLAPLMMTDDAYMNVIMGMRV